METSINIISTANGKKKQKSIANINPSATNAELSEVGKMINALSTNTYVETIRINKQNVLEPSGGKTEPELLLEYKGDGNFNIVYDGDGELFGFVDFAFICINRDMYECTVIEENGQEPSDSYSVTIFASEGEDYAAKSVTYVKEV